MINITNEEDREEIVVFVGIKPRIDTDTEFEFLFESIDSKGNKSHERLRPEIVEAKAILLPKIIRNNEPSEFDDMEEEEYEYDILWDTSKRLWTTLLRSGNYLITAKAKGYKELNKYI